MARMMVTDRSPTQAVVRVGSDALLDKVLRLMVFGQDAPKQLASSEHDLIARLHASIPACGEVESEYITTPMPVVANGLRNGNGKPSK